MESFVINEKFNASAEVLYNAWMDSKIHSKMTGGGKAKIENKINGKFKVWDNYISGKTLELIPHKKISQQWRTTEFAEKDTDSLLEITFKELKSTTKLTLKHSGIPDGQGEEYKQGWSEFYFEPMKEYFGK